MLLLVLIAFSGLSYVGSSKFKFPAVPSRLTKERNKLIQRVVEGVKGRCTQVSNAEKNLQKIVTNGPRKKARVVTSPRSILASPIYHTPLLSLFFVLLTGSQIMPVSFLSLSKLVTSKAVWVLSSSPSTTFTITEDDLQERSFTRLPSCIQIGNYIVYNRYWMMSKHWR